MTLSSIRRLTAWSRRAGLALSFGLAAVTLAACGGGPNVPPPVASAQPTPTTTLPSTLPPATTPGAAVRVALLLPLSGNNAALGQVNQFWREIDANDMRTFMNERHNFLSCTAPKI